MNLDDTLDLLTHDPYADVDLGELGLRLAADEYPSLDVDAYLSRFDQMADEVREELGDRPLADQVRTLCSYLFIVRGFRGNVENYYDPKNSYLNEVLDNCQGIPITLSVVAMAVGRRAGLRIEGVGLPGHFIAKAVCRHAEVFFDPFNAGRVLSAADGQALAEQFVKTTQLDPAELLRSAPTHAIVVRMLNNLKNVYVHRGDHQRSVRVIERLRQLLPCDVTLRRDLGICLMGAEQHGRAINHLQDYLDFSPTPSDANLVRQWLAKARRESAKWN